MPVALEEGMGPNLLATRGEWIITVGSCGSRKDELDACMAGGMLKISYTIFLGSCTKNPKVNCGGEMIDRQTDEVGQEVLPPLTTIIWVQKIRRPKVGLKRREGNLKLSEQRPVQTN